jgi:large subunit ribosomal protein L22
MVRGRQVEQGINILRFAPKKSARLVLKVLEAALANARHHRGSDPDKLWISAGWVDMGRSIKRFMPRARGSATPIIKRSAHITIELTERR